MIKIHDKLFQPYIEAEQIQHKIRLMASELNVDYENKNPLVIPVLNGAFLFAADLLKALTIECEISFVKVASYTDMSSTGEVKNLIGLNENTSGRDILIIEDIVDSGRTINKLHQELMDSGAKSVEIVTLLKKPESKYYANELKYVGFDIPDRFVVGYGLDYNGLGRNIPAIYQYID